MALSDKGNRGLSPSLYQDLRLVVSFVISYFVQAEFQVPPTRKQQVVFVGLVCFPVQKPGPRSNIIHLLEIHVNSCPYDCISDPSAVRWIMRAGLG